MLKYITVESKKRKSLGMAAADVKKARADPESGDKDGEQDASKGFEFIQKKGDLFSCRDSESLAHCISADVRMGKGIAVLFKNKFGGVKELMDQGQKTGGCAILKRGERFVYYLITKDKFWQKPTYATLRESLVAMCEHCERHNVHRVSMPKIGCGLDGLQWDRVADTIRDVFKDTAITITVYTI